MLVLSRKQGETIPIGDDIKITVVRTKGDRVRVGIEAPREITVLRGELAGEGDTQQVVLGDLDAGSQQPLAALGDWTVHCALSK